MLTHPLRFEDAWAEAAPRLSATLRRRGVDASLIDDILQETAARAIETKVKYKDVEDLLRWANVVSWRIALNQWRRTRWIAPVAVPERPVANAVDDEALARYTLSEVAATMPQLAASDQAALRAIPATPAMSRTDATRFYVQRHRARARLAAMLHGLAGALAWLLGRPGRPKARTAAIAVAAPIVVFVALTLPKVGDRPPATPLLEETGPVPVMVGGQRVDTGRASSTTSPAPTAGSGTGTDRKRGTVPVPMVGVDVNDDIGVRTRPKEPEDHLACWDTVVAGVRCVDLPGPLQDLFD